MPLCVLKDLIESTGKPENSSALSSTIKGFSSIEEKLDKMTYLLDNGTPINARDREWCPRLRSEYPHLNEGTPLHTAIAERSEEIAAFLLHERRGPKDGGMARSFPVDNGAVYGSSGIDFDNDYAGRSCTKPGCERVRTGYNKPNSKPLVVWNLRYTLHLCQCCSSRSRSELKTSQCHAIYLANCIHDSEADVRGEAPRDISGNGYPAWIVIAGALNPTQDGSNIASTMFKCFFCRY